jgi:hypothetical protein
MPLCDIDDDADGRQLVADNKVAYKQLAGGVDFLDAISKNPSRNILRRVAGSRSGD